MQYQFSEGVAPDVLKRASKDLLQMLGACDLPIVLIEEWRKHDGFRGDTVEFYSADETVERNDTLEVAASAPGFLAVANDAGSRMAFLKLERNARSVFLNYMGSLSGDTMEPTEMELSQWINAGCPFDLTPEPPYSAIEMVLVRLDRIPEGGLAELVRLKRLLNLETTMLELRALGTQVPRVLCSLPYIQALTIAQDVNSRSACISLWRECAPDEPMPLDYEFRMPGRA